MRRELGDTTARLNNVHENFQTAEVNLGKLKAEKTSLERKHMKTCDEVKLLKSEATDLKKENSKINIALKTFKKEAKENNFEHEKVLKKNEATIQELLEFKMIKTSEENVIKKKEKKLNKKLKVIEEKEEKLKIEKSQVETKTDINKNETFTEENLSHFTVSIPTKNKFEGLDIIDVDGIENDFVDNVPEDSSVEQTIIQVETKIRENLKASIKKKVEAKLSDHDLSIEQGKKLEAELMEEMEATIQEEVAAFKYKMEYLGQAKDEVSSNTTDEEPEEYHFYWGGEDCNEMIFYDQSP